MARTRSSDTETPEHNSGRRVVGLLDKAEWIIVTNGKLWRQPDDAPRTKPYASY